MPAMQIISVVKAMIQDAMGLLPVSLFSWILGVASSEMVFLMGLGVVIGGIGGTFSKITCSAQKKVWENDVSKLREKLKDARNKEYKLLRSYDEKVDRASKIVGDAEKETRRVGQLLAEEEARRKQLEDIVVNLWEVMDERADEINWWTNEAGCGTPEDWSGPAAGSEECTAVTEWRKYRRRVWSIRDSECYPPPDNWWELVKIVENRASQDRIKLDEKIKSSEKTCARASSAISELRKEKKRMGNVLVSILDIVECRLLPQLRDKKWTVAPTELDALQFVLSPIVEDLVLIATMCVRGGETWSVKMGTIAKTTEGKLGVVSMTWQDGDVKLRFADGEESDWIKMDTLSAPSESEEAKWKQSVE